VLAKSSNAPAVAYPGRGKPGGLNLIRARGEYREIVHSGPNGDSVVLGTSIAPVTAQLHRLALWLAVAGVALVAFGLAGGWWVAGHTLQPISQISAAAEQIAGGDLSRRIDVHETESELGQLVTVLNRTFDRLEKAFEQQTRFTADASHELRTPIAVMLTQIQLACSRPRDADSYRQTLETCGRAVERMRGLVNNLLELSRVDSGEFEIARADCDLARIARESLEFISPLARQKNAVLHESLESVTVKADAGRLGQVIINLLNNALQHNANGIEVTLTVQRKRDRAILRVADNGTGIPKEALPQLFERFFRGDKSRSRMGDSGGHGLGLAISQAIIKAHGGTLRLESQPGQGAEFVVELPLREA
jgi:heavy metal sensor kinase